ncbi:MAG: response regulator [Ignavibacteria bacterium]|nr:response regulator [Ignavibacteria bacterium]
MKILIVDDSSLSRRILTKIISGENRQIIEAKDGLSAIEIFSIEKPDLVFLDLNMPDIPGLEVLKSIKELDPNSKVIIATADLQEITKKLALESGASYFINKPFNENEIQNLITSIEKGG